MVNAGAITTTSPDPPAGPEIADRFDHVAATWWRLASGGRVGVRTR